jgi:flagellar assembly protein FliH
VKEDHRVPVSPFVYSPAPGWTTERDSETMGGQLIAASAPRPEEEFRAREKQAWEQGFHEGVARERAEAAASIAELREGIAHALSRFAQERDSYFHRVESEVVSLALAIVRKILQRESQLDPLLLSGLVRVALEKMAVTETVRLRAHPSQIPTWQEFFTQHPQMPLTPDLAGDPALGRNECVLETDFGVAALNLESQLKEIEQGLFDLLAQRPGAAKEDTGKR